jgi:hypothetical protein
MTVYADMSEVEAWRRVLLAAQFAIREREEVDLDDVAREVYDAAKAAVPVKTGALQASIYLRRRKEERRIGSPLKYGFFQEFGTSRHPPQPWLYQHMHAANERLFGKLGRSGVEVLE